LVSLIRLSLDPLLHRELVFLPSNQFIVGVSGGIISRPSKRSRLLQPREISELIVDTDSDEARLSSDVSSVAGDVSSVEGGTESVPGLSQPQPYRQTASFHESSSSISSSASDEGDAGESVPGEQTQQPNNPTMDTPLLPSEQCSAHTQGAPEERRTMKRPS